MSPDLEAMKNAEERRAKIAIILEDNEDVWFDDNDMFYRLYDVYKIKVSGSAIIRNDLEHIYLKKMHKQIIREERDHNKRKKSCYMWQSNGVIDTETQREDKITSIEFKILKGLINEVLITVARIDERVKFIPRDITEPIGTKIVDRVNEEVGEHVLYFNKRLNDFDDRQKGLGNKIGAVIAMLAAAGYSKKLKKGKDF